MASFASQADLIVVRGHPGSGKTTFAQALQAERPGMRHLENDQWFTDTNGHYQYDFARHQEVKQACLEAAEQALVRGEAVVVSNTFTTLAEIEPFLAVAKALGRTAHVVEMYGDFPNAHGVPASVVEAKKATFEPFLGAEKIPVTAPEVAETVDTKARLRSRMR
jgi:predicted kinase